ncbi:MAG TPA: hypothetical protein VNY05_08695 [Candidatus Acidoferrales bacterium]|nr:hypothetical protein [Candidatus Acidoferrales bacterium]
MLYKIILTGILASTLMLAQRGGGGGGGRGGGGGNIPIMSSGGGSRLDRIAEALKLTREQKKDLKATLDDAQKEATPIHDQLMKGRDAIAEAVAAGKSQDEVTQLVAANSVLDAQIAGIELKAFTTIFKGLDKDQQTKPGMPMIFQGMKGIFNGKNWNSAEDGR